MLNSVSRIVVIAVGIVYTSFEPLLLKWFELDLYKLGFVKGTQKPSYSKLYNNFIDFLSK